MSYFLICVLSLILGVLLCPIVIFLRARRCEGWDSSNMTNILRVFSHQVSVRRWQEAVLVLRWR
ncbi:hypothetical protein [Campylobacter concisus]|uniref:hypothetical protein n=1 Tax=Campylobacter concisus TaxID=199 RepID=UPI00112FAEDB|nr:hypothetical protein [Campylobacter concisus]